jgi:hypothetical protein
MSVRYQPELGQMAFGANFEPVPMAGYVQAGLARLGAAAAAETDSGADPTDNSGASLANGVFALRAFCWCDGGAAGHGEGCPSNFDFAGGTFALEGAPEPVALAPLVADWYKYLGRGGSQSRQVSRSEWARIEAVCAASIPGSGAKSAREALSAALAPVSPYPISIAVEGDAAQLFLSLVLPGALEPSPDALDVAGIEATVSAAEAAIAAAVAPLGWGGPMLLGDDERYWLATPWPPDFDDSAQARACWRPLDAEALEAFRAEFGREPLGEEGWLLLRHSAINLRRGLERAEPSRAAAPDDV